MSVVTVHAGGFHRLACCRQTCFNCHRPSTWVIWPNHSGASTWHSFVAGTLCWQLFAWKPASSGDGYNFYFDAPGGPAMRQQFKFLASKSAAASA